MDGEKDEVIRTFQLTILFGTHDAAKTGSILRTVIQNTVSIFAISSGSSRFLVKSVHRFLNQRVSIRLAKTYVPKKMTRSLTLTDIFINGTR